MINDIYIIKLDATVGCDNSRTPAYLRHLADGRVVKYPIASNAISRLVVITLGRQPPFP